MTKVSILLLLAGLLACVNQKEGAVIGSWITVNAGEHADNAYYGTLLTVDSNQFIFKSIGGPTDTISVQILSDSIHLDTSSFSYHFDGKYLTNDYDSLNQVSYTRLVSNRSFDESQLLGIIQNRQWEFAFDGVEYQITFLDTVSQRTLIRSEFRERVNTCELRINSPLIRERYAFELTYYAVENYNGQTFLRIENVFDYQFTWLLMVQEIDENKVRAVLWQEGQKHTINLRNVSSI